MVQPDLDAVLDNGRVPQGRLILVEVELEPGRTSWQSVWSSIRAQAGVRSMTDVAYVTRELLDLLCPPAPPIDGPKAHRRKERSSHATHAPPRHAAM